MATLFLGATAKEPRRLKMLEEHKKHESQQK